MAVKNKKEKVTLEYLAQEMRSGFVSVDVKIKESEKRIIKEMDSKIDTKIEDLAIMTKNGFDGVDKKHAEHDNRFTALEMAIKFGFGESKEMFKKLEEKIDKNNTLLDGYVNKQESFKEEFVVMKEEMKQVKEVIKNKLAVEIKAV